MTTTMYLVRHAATAANLATPAKLQGRRSDPPLDPVGIEQAVATRAALANVPFAASYSSPLLRAKQTAELIAPVLPPQLVAGLTECDVGRWEGIDWETIRQNEPEEYARYHSDPARFGYPDGESFADVFARSSPALDEIWERHAGGVVLVVSHHVVNRTYLAAIMGLPLSRARQISLVNCSVSVLHRDRGTTTVADPSGAWGRGQAAISPAPGPPKTSPG